MPAKIHHSMVTGNTPIPFGESLSTPGDVPALPKFAVVIPAYNEAKTIRTVAEGALQCLSKVIVVDDGSVDDTFQALEGLPLTLLRHPTNLGKAASLWSGFQHALQQGITAVVTLDGDGQHAPEDIPRLLKGVEQAYNFIIIGARTRPWTRAIWHRILANRIADFWISWAAGYPIEDSQSGFRVYPSALLYQVKLPTDRKNSFVFESEILIEGANLGFRSLPLPIESEPRALPRPSYFRPIIDISRITIMVGKRLLSEGMAPRKLLSAVLGHGFDNPLPNLPHLTHVPQPEKYKRP